MLTIYKICRHCCFPALELPQKTTFKFHTVVQDTVQVRWETFTSLCSKFIEDTTHQILSESSTFCRKYNKNILAYFFGHDVHTQLYTSVIIAHNTRHLSFIACTKIKGYFNPEKYTI